MQAKNSVISAQAICIYMWSTLQATAVQVNQSPQTHKYLYNIYIDLTRQVNQMSKLAGQAEDQPSMYKTMNAHKQLALHACIQINQDKLNLNKVSQMKSFHP